MSRNSIRTQSDPDHIFEVLDDAHAYPRWVVGARRVRRVDAEWPAVGSRFHHAVGTAAGELHDSSKVIARQPPRHLRLEVRFRPLGVANVDLDIEPADSGSVVTITEEPVNGPAAWLPHAVSEPMLTLRNALALQRLRRLADSTRVRERDRA